MNTVDLNFGVTGEGDGLIILHGLFGMGRNWAAVARALADGGRRALTIDLRNHGCSPWADEMTYDAMAADVARLIDAQFGSAGADVIGHSMGGKTAMTLALTQPERVRRLCVVDIAPVPYDHDFEAHLQAMANLDASVFERRSEAEAALLEALDDAFLARFLIRNLKADPHGGFQWGVNLDALARHMDDLLDFPIFEADQAFEGPALFLAGGTSDYIQPHHQAEIERLFPAAEIQIVDDAGHWLHADKPDETVRRLAAFLDT